jgi:hypothetical protein
LKMRRRPWGSVWRGVRPASRARRAEIALGLLAAFRGELYRYLTARAGALFDLAEAVLCADGPVRVLEALSLAPEHRRGHGAAYDAVNAGRVDIARLRWSLAPGPTGGSGWRSMSATGCGRVR